MRTNQTFDDSFRDLVAAWSRHESIRATGDLPALWESRQALDSARQRAAAARRGIS